MENLKNVSFPKVEARIILRQSTDGRIAVIENTNADYAVLQDGVVVGIYALKNEAFHTFGILTRAQ
jgi:ABC-type metal ion transport system substrate-binding protein